MKITPAKYATALVAAVSKKTGAGERRAIEKFIDAIRRNGDWGHRKFILQACEDAIREEVGRGFLIIESARPLTAENRQLIIKAFGARNMDVDERINHELIAGVRLTLDRAFQLDLTLSKMLSQMFK